MFGNNFSASLTHCSVYYLVWRQILCLCV